ncbi:MAG TPA: hypothetical protein VLF18_13010 [Tahibacter sp.]|uniref:hypothetical protein n=1 Tax=Tahibacter sp. TaxID=2056211 RepID=UPI002B7A8F35|nr:hypothetical protein [Tahibacter sp.]HSX61117.1 hypothetical protein [Tahibacter sp.]
MDETEQSAGAPHRRRRRVRRGLFKRVGRWFDLGGELRDSAIALLRAEARLARAAVPNALIWIAVVSLGGVFFLATIWGAALLLLYQWTGSIGQALLWLGAVSAVVLAVGSLLLRHAVRAASFAESRRRIAYWLERSDLDDDPDEDAGT